MLRHSERSDFEWCLKVIDLNYFVKEKIEHLEGDWTGKTLNGVTCIPGKIFLKRGSKTELIQRAVPLGESFLWMWWVSMIFRVTVSGPGVTVGGVSSVLGGGNAAAIVWPGRGGGIDRPRNAKSFSSPSCPLSPGKRASSACVCDSESSSEGAGPLGSCRSGSAFDRRKPSPVFDGRTSSGPSSTGAAA